MTVPFLEGQVLTAVELNAAFSEAVNTDGYFVFSANPGMNQYPFMSGEHVHNAKLTANSGFIVNTVPAHFLSSTYFSSNVYAQEPVIFSMTTDYFGDLTIHTSNINAANGTLNITSALQDGLGNVRTVPRDNAYKPNGYTLLSTDIGKYVYATGDVIIPAGIFGIGDNITIYNGTSSTINLFQGTGVTMWLAGIGLGGNRTLDQRGLCSVLCVNGNEYVLIGAGLN